MSWGWWVLALIDLAVIGYIWRSVSKVDDEIDASEAFRKELLQEMEQYNRVHRVPPLPRADIDAPYEAFMLDGNDHPHPPKKAA